MTRSRLLPDDELDGLVQRLMDRLPPAGAGRLLLGIAGAPGAGKTTLAEDLVAALTQRMATTTEDDTHPHAGTSTATSTGPLVAHLPMDGFHLADVQLDALGLRARKGAQETFDGYGFLAMLRRLRSDEGVTVYVPGFERVLEQPVAAALAIPPSARVVVSEGNYLLVDSDPWPQVRALFDEVWFVDISDRERQARLVTRHTRFGKDVDSARSWALGPDQANADLILATRDRADLVVVAAERPPE